MRGRFPFTNKLIIMLGDIGIIIVAAYLAMVAVVGNKFSVHADTYLQLGPLMLAVMLIIFHLHGLYSLARKRFAYVTLSLAVAVLQLLVFVMAGSFFLRYFDYSRAVLILTACLQFLLLLPWRYLFWRLDSSHLQCMNTMLVGSQAECFKILARLDAMPHLGYKVCHVCLEWGGEQERQLAENIDLIIICASVDLDMKASVLQFCYLHNKQVMLVPAVYEGCCSCVDLDKIDDIPVLKPRYLKPTLEERTVKRCVDMVIGSSALLALWPVMLAVAAAVKVSDGGPVFYKQIRVGEGGKRFNILKFRTMIPNAEGVTGPRLAAAGDDRTTPAGRFLRATRLDELPQLLNVLAGDMSIVGPRPERPFFVDQFAAENPEYVYRHNVKPGITGLAQISGKYNTNVDHKLIYDLMYIQKCGLFTDLTIMIQTVRVLVTKSSTEGIAVPVRTDLTSRKLEQY